MGRKDTEPGWQLEFGELRFRHDWEDTAPALLLRRYFDKLYDATPEYSRDRMLRTVEALARQYDEDLETSLDILMAMIQEAEPEPPVDLNARRQSISGGA